MTKRGEIEIVNFKLILAIIIIGILFGILYATWIGLTAYKGCDTWECFNEKLESCSKAKFAGGKDIIFGYTIHGKNNGLCKIDVEFLQGELTEKSTRNLKNEKMTCFTPIGAIMLPEAELKNCHGILKEKLQEQVISQLHNFIIQNMGQVNKELLNPLLTNN
jgi:hypothetical protein